MPSEISIGVVIPTYQAVSHLKGCVQFILSRLGNVRVLVVDSSSKDNTVELAKQLGAETLVIPQTEFNHGATREMARKYLNTDIVIMMTQDAYPVDSSFLEHLVRPIIEGKAAVTYARQIPHKGADFFESFPRQFNYPAISHIRGTEDIDKYGSYTFFCSNSCAAWSNAALDEIGGFFPVLTNEDTFAVAKLLQKGYHIAYVAEAVVHHSHRYSLVDEFTRYFDTGYVRKLYRYELFSGQKDEKHGAKFTRSMLFDLWKEKPSLVPYAFIQLIVKYLGFKTGYLSTRAPLWFVRRMSGQSYYWTGKYNTHGKS